MKVTYEFMIENDGDGYLDYRIFQKSQEMYAALIELEGYVTHLKKEYINDDKEEILSHLFEIIFNSEIGDIE